MHHVYCRVSIPNIILSNPPFSIFKRSIAMATKSRTYNDAIDALNSLQTPYNIIEARRKAGIRPDASSIQEMKGYLSRIGYSTTDLTRLSIIHVAGTKGKGSTCAFTSSILSQYQSSHSFPTKIGLFTSPHLIAVRERIRINSAPLSESLFAKYFFQVWDRLEATAPSHSASEKEVDPLRQTPPKPIYARYLTLLSYHVFLSEGVDVAVYETGIGGEYDATNVVQQPLVTGISTLGIDHVFVLGKTVGEIAWHKAGIMKNGTPAFSVQQVPEAEEVLRKRAVEKSVDLKILGVDKRLEGVKVRPDADFQRRNATLAVALAETALGRLDPGFEVHGDRLPKEFIDGIEQVVWRGRCEVKDDQKDRVVWYVDGAHTVDSLKVTGTWYKGEASGKRGPRALIFNQQGRTEAVDFLEGLYEGVRDDEDGRAFETVVFCTNVTYAETGYKRDFVNHQHDPKDIENLTQQRIFAEKWKTLDPAANVLVLPTIEHAIEYVRSQSRELKEEESVQAFVTGSLHLVGGALGILEGADAL